MYRPQIPNGETMQTKPLKISETPIAKTGKMVRVRLLAPIGNDDGIKTISKFTPADGNKIPEGTIVEIDEAVEVHWTANEICKRTRPGATQ